MESLQDQPKLSHGRAKRSAVRRGSQVPAARLQLEVPRIWSGELRHQIRSTGEQVVRRICRRIRAGQDVVVELDVRKKSVQRVFAHAMSCALHAEGVVERDVVPENKPLDRDWRTASTAVRLDEIAALQHRILF